MLVLQMHISPFSQNICLQDINLVTFDFFPLKKTNSKGKILKCKKGSYKGAFNNYLDKKSWVGGQ